METFTLDKIHYFRAKIDATHPRSFSQIVHWFQVNSGLSRGKAINAARRTYPNVYNAEMTLLHQHKGATPSHVRASTGSSSPVQRFVRLLGA